MIAVQGQYYDGTSSRAWPAELREDDTGLWLAVGDERVRLDPAACTVSERLGRLPRKITLAGGGSFVTGDNESVDRLFGGRGPAPRAGGLLHRLESSWPYTLAGLVLVIAIGWWVVVDGVPALARLIAERLPDPVYVTLSEQTLELLREQYLEASSLPESRQQALRAEFQGLVAGLDWPPGFRLFNQGVQGGGMANAFALPDGSIVVTDELVGLDPDGDEVLAVLAHEAGHVMLRHGMQRLVHDSILLFAITMVTGDTSGLSATGLGLPALMLGLKYSRQAEREADEFALRLLAAQGRDPALLARMLEKLDPLAARESAQRGTEWTGYLSTHPATRERIAHIRGRAGELGF